MGRHSVPVRGQSAFFSQLTQPLFFSSAVHCTRSFRVQSTGCERGGLLPPVRREARPDLGGWPPWSNFSLASLHRMWRERTRLRVRAFSHLLAWSIRSGECQCSAVIYVDTKG